MAITFSTLHRQALFVLAATAATPAAAQERLPQPPGEVQGAPPAAQQLPSERPSEAQRTPSAATRPVRFAIDGLAPDAQVRVVSRSERVPEAASTALCTADCELELEKGAYTLIASRGDEHRTKEIELASSQILKVGEWDGLARTMGTALGITGIIVGAIGALATVAVMAAPSPGPDDDEVPLARAGVLWFGILGVAAGTGLTIGGFSLAAANRAPSMDLRRMPTTHPPAPGANAGISLGGKF